MGNTMLNELEQVRDLFLKKLQTLSDIIASNPKVDFKEWESPHSKSLGGHKIDYLLSIVLENKIGNRKIHFSYYDGLNGEKKECNSFSVLIENTTDKQVKRSKFSFEEYLRFRNIDLEIKTFFEKSQFQNSLSLLNQFLTHLENWLKNENLKSIIKGEEWIEIPIDMRPYK